MKGLHIIGDLYNCAPNEFLISAKALRTLCVGACKTAGLSVLGDHFYQFDALAKQDEPQAAGATGAVVLAESHLAIHTWPERNQATLDVYVCNVTADNISTRSRIQFFIESHGIRHQAALATTVSNGVAAGKCLPRQIC